MLDVGLDTSALDPNFKEHAARGIGRYVKELKNYFEANPPQDVRVRFFQHNSFARLPLVERVLDRFPAGKTTLENQLLYPIRMGLSQRLGRDLLHFPAHMDAPSWSTRKYIVTVLDMIPLVMEHLYRPECPGWRFELARWFENRGIRGATLVLAISQNTAKDVNRILQIPFERIVVTPLGVDSKFFEVEWGRDDEDLRRRYAIPSGRPLILYVGGIDQRKNCRGLLCAFKELLQIRREKKLDLPLLFMAGKIQTNRQFPKLKALITEFGLEPQVLMPGYVPDADLVKLYGISSALCFLSYYEGFGLTPLEAMAAGLPVVSSNTSCMPEVLQDAAIMVDPDAVSEAAQSLAALLENRELARSYSERGRKQAMGFTWAKTGELTLEAYRRFIKS
ncbi:MAG: glycosyltransferase family 4 protein [Deltaproteobacteria bacterium]|nr:glycosyltransferase family 4 protein [Deltaproteobacteria bacterium]